MKIPGKLDPPHHHWCPAERTTVRDSQDSTHDLLRIFQSRTTWQLSEASQNSLKLETADPRIFELVKKWLYSGRVWNFTLGQPLTHAYDESGVKIQDNMLCEACRIWIFADYYGMQELQNYTMDSIIASIARAEEDEEAEPAFCYLAESGSGVHMGEYHEKLAASQHLDRRVRSFPSCSR